MQTLFAISVLSLLVLVTAGVAIVRHIRISATDSVPEPERDFGLHLLAAAEGRTHGTAQSDAVRRQPRFVPTQTVKDVMANKSWNQPPETITLHPDPEVHLAYEEKIRSYDDVTYPDQGGRKGPQNTQRHGRERLDWAYFNKDLGDLTDPYETPRLRANSRNGATSPKRS